MVQFVAAYCGKSLFMRSSKLQLLTLSLLAGVFHTPVPFEISNVY